ncbi:hypothetical protein L873DRAFT_1056178 [Choiromyces venosus 120613-1]|uniref:Uncharacterized protein n=1 Tax=Choiromyces venosus 120613-1 TaxID=1336337 RepID=A0A3N4JIS6_9PEZI|nr:hypothetical protein L873DRAFT_1056178 [Choiromyces venosus 120613-1]
MYFLLHHWELLRPSISKIIVVYILSVSMEYDTTIMEHYFEKMGRGLSLPKYMYMICGTLILKFPTE